MQVGAYVVVLVVMALPAVAEGEGGGGAQWWEQVVGGTTGLLGPGGVAIAVGALFSVGRALQQLATLEKGQEDIKKSMEKSQAEIKSLVESKFSVLSNRVGLLTSGLLIVASVLATDAFERFLATRGP